MIILSSDFCEIAAILRGARYTNFVNLISSRERNGLVKTIKYTDEVADVFAGSEIAAKIHEIEHTQKKFFESKLMRVCKPKMVVIIADLFQQHYS